MNTLIINFIIPKYLVSKSVLSQSHGVIVSQN